MRQLAIVLKISERCNMACQYCYFFFGGDDTYLKHSAVMKENVIEQLSLFIQTGITDLNINHVSIILHGGEPLLLKKLSFIKMLDTIIEKIPKKCTYSFRVQINGLLVDDEWVAIFEKYNIGVGISIDGPKEYHDKYRIDKKGNGTYDRIVDKLKILQNAQDSKKISGIGCLSVINKDFDPGVIFNHLVKTLRFQNIDLLLYQSSKISIKDLSSFYRQ